MAAEAATISKGPATCLTITLRHEQDLAVVEMVLRYLGEVRQKRANGRLTFDLDVADGGVRDKWAQARYRER